MYHLHLELLIPLLATGMIGFIAAEILTYYWNSKHYYKSYIFDRRIHHGEIGILLLVILLSGKIPSSLASAIIGFGIGLIRDDVKDGQKWFKFHKKT